MESVFIAESGKNDILAIRTSTQMVESSLWSQAQGERHKKQEKVMSRTFVNFTQVKTEIATTA